MPEKNYLSVWIFKGIQNAWYLPYFSQTINHILVIQQPIVAQQCKEKNSVVGTWQSECDDPVCDGEIEDHEWYLWILIHNTINRSWRRVLVSGDPELLKIQKSWYWMTDTSWLNKFPKCHWSPDSWSHTNILLTWSQHCHSISTPNEHRWCDNQYQRNIAC